MLKQKQAKRPLAPSSKLEGLVLSCGGSGNLITDISNESVAGLLGDESVSVKFGGHETFGIFSADHGEPNGTLVASLGSDAGACLQIEIVGLSLAEMLGIKAGVGVSVSW